MPFEEDESCDKKTAGSDSHEGYGVAVSALGGGWCGGGVVTALSTALGMGWKGTEGREEQACGECQSLHWKKTSRTKRNIQKMPIECQYQEAQSTMIWRLSSERET